VLTHAAERVRRYLGDPSAADGALASVVVRLAALRGDDGLYDEYLRHLRAARSPEEEHRYLDALAEFERPKLIQRTLELMLTRAVPGQELRRLASQIAAQGPTARDAAWRFATSHFESLEAKAPRLGWLLPTAQQFCDDRAPRQIERFFAEREPSSATARQVELAAERVSRCAALRQRSSGELARWARARFAEARSMVRSAHVIHRRGLR
jgi:aminopeptidase N